MNNLDFLYNLQLTWFNRGLSPSDCDYNLLDVARRLEMYGIILYPARVSNSIIILVFISIGNSAIVLIFWQYSNFSLSTIPEISICTRSSTLKPWKVHYRVSNSLNFEVLQAPLNTSPYNNLDTRPWQPGLNPKCSITIWYSIRNSVHVAEKVLSLDRSHMSTQV